MRSPKRVLEGLKSKACDKTIGGMSIKRIQKLIASLKDYSYHPNPARRTYIAKNNNPKKKCPLGIPLYDNKLVQEIIRLIL